MRSVFFAAISLLATQVGAQALESDFVFGRDYTFERAKATRRVDDAKDAGTIELVAYVYRPLKHDRHEVVLWSHGSTGGMITGPKEPIATPAPVVRFFVSRGYTLVAPQRRGRGESGGKYVEECSVFTRECTAEQQTALAETAIAEALRDTDAVLDQVVLGHLVDRDARIIAAGHSRGGFLSLMLAGERPRLVAAVVNFSGGWHGVTARLDAAERERRMADHAQRLAQAAKRATIPTLWIYAARDPLYQDGVPQAMVATWRDAGGKAELVYVTDHTLPNAHLTPQAPALWQGRLAEFMAALDAKPP
ncbi:MAG TPA: alpha/beta fold hydrolase [Xanthomonadales bacterium]|nr:alpha/beta fold hydrolase [Xanthomonadales bacterium]